MNDRSLFSNHASTLRGIIEATGVASLREIVAKPGVRGVYRVTVYHGDGDARDTVTTLVDRRGMAGQIEVVFRVTFGEQPILHSISEARIEAWVHGLQALHFDKMSDQPNLPLYGADLWMIERMAGSFYKGVIVSPDVADAEWLALCGMVRMRLPEALREIR